MKNTKISILVFLVMISLVMAGCFNISSSSDKDYEEDYNTDTITHAGFKFSTSQFPTMEDGFDWGETEHDGYIMANWNSETEGYDSLYIYFYDDRRVEDLGAVNISSITDISNTTIEDNSLTLIKDHVYIAKVIGGWVKFVVLEETNLDAWESKVKWAFSETGKFNY